MSPEYAMDGHFSTKSDVFSFGVLVLEIVSGKRNNGSSYTSSDLNLLGHVSTNSDISKIFKVSFKYYFFPKEATIYTLNIFKFIAFTFLHF